MNFDRRLLRLVLSARWMVGGAILFAIGGGVLVILQAILFSRSINGVFLEGKDLAGVLPWMLALLAVIGGRALFAFLADGLAAAAAVRIKSGLREKLMAHILSLGPAYTRQTQTGTLVSSALQGVEAIDPYFSQYLPQLVLAAVLPLAILGAVFPLDFLTGVIFLVTAPLVPLFMVLIGSVAESLTRRQFGALRRMSAYFLDTLQGLATLKALTANDVVAVKSKLIQADDWLSALQENYQPGDIIVCHEEQYLRNGFLKVISARSFLLETFKAPVYWISGFYPPWQVLSRKWLYTLLFWVGCLVILAGFSLLEIQIDRNVQGVYRTALILIALVFEFGAFWAWNHLPKI